MERHLQRKVDDLCYVIMRHTSGKYRAGILKSYGEGKERELAVVWYNEHRNRIEWVRDLVRRDDLPVVSNLDDMRHILWRHEIRHIKAEHIFGWRRGR